MVLLQMALQIMDLRFISTVFLHDVRVVMRHDGSAHTFSLRKEFDRHSTHN